MTYDGDNELTVNGHIEATSIVADWAYKLSSEGKTINALQGFLNGEGLWSVMLWINNESYINMDCTEDNKHSNIRLKAKNIFLDGNAYSQTGQIITSDRNAKNNIKPLTDKHIKLLSLLQPVSFTFIDGESGRTHIGFISQEVENAMTQAELTDLDFAGFCKKVKTVEIKDENGNKKYEVEKDENGDPVYIYSLRYEEFIALNTFMIQNLQKENQDIKERLLRLEETVYKQK